jgi:hypothetical protein
MRFSDETLLAALRLPAVLADVRAHMRRGAASDGMVIAKAPTHGA